MARFFVVIGAVNFEIGWLCDGNQCSRDDGFCPGHLSGGKTLLIDEVVAAHDEADAKAQAFQRAREKTAFVYPRPQFAVTADLDWIEWDDEPDIAELPEDKRMKMLGHPTLPI